MSLAPGATLGPYEILAPLGAGGMGEVYRARDTKLNRDVAIKVLPEAFAQDAERLARFTREAQTLAALNHPNILSVHDTGSDRPGSVAISYIVTELLSGDTLRERLNSGPLAVRRAVEIAIQLARGLGAAHGNGIVHRDLKPENIFLLDDGQVRILDFGLARPVMAADHSDATQTMAVTEPGTVMGTVGYMAPEQVRGHAVDGRADLFAFGAVLYEMVSGQRAFQRDTAADTMTAILTLEPPELAGSRPNLSPTLDRLIRHCLEKNANERFQSARDVAFALESLSGSNVTAGAVQADANAPDRRRWAPLFVAAGLVILAGVGGLLAGRSLATPAESARIFIRKTFQPESIFNARFLPDGQTIIFSAALAGNAPSLFEVRSGTLEARPLGPPRTHLLSVSSKGELAILIDAHFINHQLFAGTLARMTLEGAPRPWLDSVRDADWNADGSTLAIVRDTGGTDQLEYPIGKVLYSTGGYVSDVRISPDGTRVAFMDHQLRYDNRGWVKVVDQLGKVTVLAGEFHGEEGVAWSSDGSRLFFGANLQRGPDGGASNYQILTVATNHAEATRPAIVSAGADFVIHDIARDGRWLAMREDGRRGVVARGAGQPAERELGWLSGSSGASLSQDGEAVLFSDLLGDDYSTVWRKVDGSPVVRLGAGSALGLSPDGHWALARVFSPSQLIAYPLGTREPIRLERGPLEGIQGAFWFPDSQSILVIGNEQSKQTRAYRQRLVGGPPQPVLPEGVLPLAISPDGNAVVARDAVGRWQWHPMNGAAPRPISELGTQDKVAGWSVDGKSLFVRRDSDVPARVERLELATGRRSLFKEFSPADRAGLVVFTPFVTDDPDRYAYSYRKRLSTLFVVTGVK